MIILHWILWFVITTFLGFIDAHRNNGGKGILFGYHLASFIIRYMVAFLLILFVHYKGDFSWLPLGSPFWQGLWEAREIYGCFILMGAVFWVWFDMTYNLFRFNVPWDYVGETSWLDLFFRRFKDPFQVQLFAKLILLIIGLIFYFV